MIVGDGGNVAVYITSEGVILVDNKYDQDHAQIMARIRSVTNQPVRYILSTHYHADHSGGNTLFTNEAEIISTRNAHDGIVKHLQSNAPNNMAAARITFTDETTIFLGGKEVRSKYYGRAHTNGDVLSISPRTDWCIQATPSPHPRQRHLSSITPVAGVSLSGPRRSIP